MIKNFIILILIYIFLNSSSFANINEKILKEIKNTETIFFEFEQQINDEYEIGDCVIKYPKLIKCNYDDKYKKMIISNGKTLAIIQRRYKKIFYYSLKRTPLFYLLDKEYLIDLIKKNEPTQINDYKIEYEFNNDGKKITVIFDKKTFNLIGWKTLDIYQNNVKFIIKNSRKNENITKNFFRIPKEEDL